jgi:quinol monooxygenase YgiN
MPLYQIKIVIQEYKIDEFVDSLRSLLPEFRKEKACLVYSLYRDIEKENTCCVVAEWKTRKTMEKHFKTQNFEVLIGAARVLGEKFEMNIVEGKERGGFKLATHGFKTPSNQATAE